MRGITAHALAEPIVNDTLESLSPLHFEPSSSSRSSIVVVVVVVVIAVVVIGVVALVDCGRHDVTWRDVT